MVLISVFEVNIKWNSVVRRPIEKYSLEKMPTLNTKLCTEIIRPSAVQAKVFGAQIVTNEPIIPLTTY